MMERQTLLNPGITTMRDIVAAPTEYSKDLLQGRTERGFLTSAWGFSFPFGGLDGVEGVGSGGLPLVRSHTFIGCGR